MLAPFRWLLHSLAGTPKPRRAVRRRSGGIEPLESRLLLTTIFSEGFEGTWPGEGWSTVASQGRVWDDNSTRARTGSWSGFSADLTNGTGQTSYVSNMNTSMTRTVDLSDFRNVTLSYWRFLNTEASFDTLQVTVFKAGVGTVSSTVLSGSLQSWVQDTLQVPESLWGQSGVSVRFTFISDGSVVPAGTAGVWIDDILMDGVQDPGFPESTLSVPSGTNVRLNQFGDISNVNGSIGSAGEIDTYGFGVDTSGSYTITVNGAVDAQLRVYNAAGNAISGIIDSTGSGGTETFTFNRTAGEAVYFQVGGYISSTGSYSFSVTGPSSSVETEVVASPTYAVSDTGSIDFAGDRDYYTFTAPLDTTTLSIALTPSANLDSFLTLLDTSGQVLTTADQGGTGGADNLTNFNITAGTTYVLMVSGFSISEGNAASENYSFTINFDPDNVGKPPSVLTVPTGTNLRLNQFGDITGVSGNISSTLDLDIFAFGVETTGSYTITAGNGVDTELRIYDSNGNAITAIQDSFGAGGTESLTVNLTAGTTCYFAVGGFNTGTGNFTVTVNGPSVTEAATAFASPNYFVTSSTSILNAGDRDYFNLTAPTGTNVLTVTLNPSANLDGVISLFDSTGALLLQRDSFGSGSSETIANFGVVAGQNYYVAFSGFSIAEGSGGAENYSYSLDFGPDLVDINVAPTIPAGQTLPIAENSTTNTVVGQVVANDANSTAPNNVLSYQIISQSPSTQFSIDANTGTITYVGPGALNFEATSQYTLSVRVTDGGGLFATQNVVVSITDVNEAPTIPAGQTLQVLENSAINTIVGTVSANDPDIVAPNNVLTYSIESGNPSNPFSINAATGQITVANPAALNFEATPQFTLQVKVTDGGAGNLNFTRSVVINLTDANDEPSIAAGQTLTVPENSTAGTTVGTVSASDPDTTAPNKTLTYVIAGGNTSTAFAINSSTGNITVNNPAVLDFEATPSFTLTIVVTDGGGLQANRDVIVNLTNVNEAPSLTGGSGTITAVRNQTSQLLPNIVVSDKDGPNDLQQVVISYFIPRRTLAADYIFSSASNLGSVAESGPTDFKKASGTRTLTITLNPGTSVNDVESFLRGISFRTKKADPKKGPLGRRIDVQVFDDQGLSSSIVSTSIRVNKK